MIPDTGGRQKLAFGACLVLVPLWLAYWLVTTRYALLDDALIHLHYADMLYLHHFITFDGVRHGFGTSSLLYVGLLAGLQKLFPSPLLPKAISDIAYLALISTVFGLIYRFRTSALSQMFLAGLAFCLLSPMGIRWSTDGMETSLTNLSVVLLLMIVRKAQEEETFSGMRFLLIVLFGAALVFLRIELALVLALSCLSILIAKASAGRSRIQSMIAACPLAFGAALALVSIRVVMGHFLPDTALAKSSHSFSVDPIVGSARVMGSALLAGFGLAICWGLSVLLSLRRIMRSNAQTKTQLLQLVLENSAIVIMIGLSCLRNQHIQGVRYLMWPLIFGIVANSWFTTSDSIAGADPMERRWVAAFFVMALCLLPLDWRLASRAMRGRSQTFLRMRSAHLNQFFQNKTIIAGDVGFITYFTNGRTCDLAGLVDGRAMAALNYKQRLAYCASQSPSVMFLSSSQAATVGTILNLDDWKVCGIFDFTNVESNDRHYLMVPSANADRVCHALDFPPEQASEIQSGS